MRNIPKAEEITAEAPPLPPSRTGVPREVLITEMLKANEVEEQRREDEAPARVAEVDLTLYTDGSTEGGGGEDGWSEHCRIQSGSGGEKVE